jgi:hypothetical protein
MQFRDRDSPEKEESGRVGPARAGHLLSWVLLPVAATLYCVCQPVSEWLPGGWDPGVYLNQGMHISRNGLNAPPLPAFAAMAEHDLSLFSTTVEGRYEAYPGIPIDVETGAFRFRFYPLTPLWIALLHRVAGAGAAFRAMSILGLLAAWLFFRGLRRCGWSRAGSSCAALLLLLQPIVLHHMHTPCSEVMELALMAALLVALTGAPPAVFFPLTAAACLNRPSFVISAGLLSLLVATGPWGRLNRRDSARAVLAIAAGIALSLLYFHSVGAESIVRIRRSFAAIELAAAGSLAAAATVLMARRCAPLERLTSSRWLTLACFALPAAIFAGSASMNPRGWHESVAVARRLVAYTGWPLLLLSGAGLLIRVSGIARGKPAMPPDLFAVICLVHFALPLGYKHAADLYPWATKRFLASLPLLCAFLAAETLWRLTRHGRGGRAAAAAMVTICIGANAPRMIHAWSRVEYRGIHKTLAALAEQIRPDDVVVADHFLWATPLTLSFGKQVLNGERLWADPSPERTARVEVFLASLQEGGHRILLLTSTENGTTVLPAPFDNARPIMSPVDYRHQTLAHHRRSSAFRLKERRSRFLLSEWEPAETSQ